MRGSQIRINLIDVGTNEIFKLLAQTLKSHAKMPAVSSSGLCCNVPITICRIAISRLRGGRQGSNEIPLKNSLVAQILDELADYTELEDDQPYRARAYRRAAQTVESLPDAIENISAEKKLKDLPGIGENIERKIDEILRTGKLETLEKIKERIPVDVPSLTRIEGSGPEDREATLRKVEG